MMPRKPIRLILVRVAAMKCFGFEKSGISSWISFHVFVFGSCGLRAALDVSEKAKSQSKMFVASRWLCVFGDAFAFFQSIK